MMQQTFGDQGNRKPSCGGRIGGAGETVADKPFRGTAIRHLSCCDSPSAFGPTVQSGSHITRANLQEPSTCRFITRSNLARTLTGACWSELFCAASKYPHSYATSPA